jgi:hypothetical protein
MLDYNPSTKLYLVRRMTIVSDIQDCERETLSRRSLRSRAEDDFVKPFSGSTGRRKSGSSLGPRAGSCTESRTGSFSYELDSIPHHVKEAVIPPIPESGKEERKRPKKISLRGIKMKEGGLESEGGTYYWVPRVRVMFSAEDPRVFASRVANAHMSRSAMGG